MSGKKAYQINVKNTTSTRYDKNRKDYVQKYLYICLNH